jgi:hypothetical protein
MRMELSKKSSQVWCTMFFIYMTYTLLALHVEECTVSGLLLGFTQVTRRRADCIPLVTTYPSKQPLILYWTK